ncbi:short-chain dehydrogenase, partial [Asaia sp. W19]|uniref:SDR family NAD(P)-dependent oxidoreductase n=2 Tax=Asaia TaxID=91914 RepID=UPI000F8D0CC6
MTRLIGKTALITGAARGIGLAIARHFIREGCRVLLSDLDHETGQAAADILSCRFVPLDVRNEAEWLALEAADEKSGAIPDIVVNNAGITGFENDIVPHDPEHASLADWRAVHQTNLDGTFLGCRYALRRMGLRGTGSIINISSRSGLVGIPGAAAYASSKAAIRNHTKTVALYAAQRNWAIRCNSIHPAAILTPMWEAMLGDGPDRETRMAALVADTPLKRFGTVDEVASLCV